MVSDLFFIHFSSGGDMPLDTAQVTEFFRIFFFVSFYFVI